VSAFVLYRVLAPKLIAFDGACLPLKTHLFWIGIVSALSYRAVLNGPCRANWPTFVVLGASLS
jgi:hypothetical protein